MPEASASTLRQPGPEARSQAPVISIEGLQVGYGSYVLMRDVAFNVRRGDIFFITGGSGCGKSTLLRVLMGFKEPQKGSVRFFGQPFWPGTDQDRLAVRRDEKRILCAQTVVNLLCVRHLRLLIDHAHPVS